MTELDAQEFVRSEIMTRWQNWKPHPAEVDDYVDWLIGFTHSQALQAVKEHKMDASGQYNSPKAHKLIQMCRKAKRADGMANIAADEGHMSVPVFGIRCFDCPDYPHLEGKLLYEHWKPAGRPLASREAYRQQAEIILEHCEKRYGGDWGVEINDYYGGFNA